MSICRIKDCDVDDNDDNNDCDKCKQCDTLLINTTIAILQEYDKMPDDVVWCGSKQWGWFTWDEFMKIAKDAKNSYDEVACDLKIVGKNFWLERHEYDSDEWWEYKTLPERPKQHKKPWYISHRQAAHNPQYIKNCPAFWNEMTLQKLNEYPPPPPSKIKKAKSKIKKKKNRPIRNLKELADIGHQVYNPETIRKLIQQKRNKIFEKYKRMAK